MTLRVPKMEPTHSAERSANEWHAAQYPGVCARCGSVYEPGWMITYDYGWRAQKCCRRGPQ